MARCRPHRGQFGAPGITRDSIRRFARDLNLTVTDSHPTRSLLYIADEAFFTGTAAESRRYARSDKISVGEGCHGPGHQGDSEGVLRHREGEQGRRHTWFTPVKVRAKTAGARLGSFP